MVRLKVFSDACATAFEILFQFQSGAVKRLDKPCVIPLYAEFQFQSGAVKSKLAKHIAQ